MSRDHLSTATLLAIRDGETGDQRDLQHLATCSECQRAFDDSRWLKLLAWLRRRQQPTTNHPDADELLAYRTRALSTPRLREIREHLAGCRTCLVAYAGYRKAAQLARYSSPPPGVMRKVLRQFRPRNQRMLGTVLIRRLADGLSTVFLPEPAGLGIASLSSIPMAAEGPREVPPSKHPASARARVERSLSRSKKPVPPQQEIHDFDALENEEPTLRQWAFDRVEALSATGDASAPYDPGQPATRIEAHPWTLGIVPITEDQETTLEITLETDDPTLDPRGTRVLLVPRGRDHSEAVLDAKGAATLRCPPGNSRLFVELQTPLVVAIQFDT